MWLSEVWSIAFSTYMLSWVLSCSIVKSALKLDTSLVAPSGVRRSAQPALRGVVIEGAVRLLRAVSGQRRLEPGAFVRVAQLGLGEPHSPRGAPLPSQSRWAMWRLPWPLLLRQNSCWDTALPLGPPGPFAHNQAPFSPTWFINVQSLERRVPSKQEETQALFLESPCMNSKEAVIFKWGTGIQESIWKVLPLMTLLDEVDFASKKCHVPSCG